MSQVIDSSSSHPLQKDVGKKIQDEIAEKKGYKIIKHVHQLFVKPIKK